MTPPAAAGQGRPAQSVLHKFVNALKYCARMTTIGDNVVERKLAAFNAHDAATVVRCFAESAVIDSSDSTLQLSGRREIFSFYSEWFEDCPAVQVQTRARITVSSWVIDEEHVTGLAEGDLHEAVVYRLDTDGLISELHVLR